MQAARLRLLRTSGPSPSNLAAVQAGLGSKVARLSCTEVEVAGWTRVLQCRDHSFSQLEVKRLVLPPPGEQVTWLSGCPALPDSGLVRLLQTAQVASLHR